MTTLPPERPSVWTWLRDNGYYLFAAIAALVALLMYFAPDIHGHRDWRGPALLIGFIAAGVGVALGWRKRSAKKASRSGRYSSGGYP